MIAVFVKVGADDGVVNAGRGVVQGDERGQPAPSQRKIEGIIDAGVAGKKIGAEAGDAWGLKILDFGIRAEQTSAC